MSDDVQPSETICPQCGQGCVYRECSAIGCEDGVVSLYEDDPLWYDEDDCEPCGECAGHGHHEWCQNCGWDILEKRFLNGSPSVELPASALSVSPTSVPSVSRPQKSAKES